MFIYQNGHCRIIYVMGLAWSTGKNRTFIFQIQSNLIISTPDWQQVQKIYGEKVGVPLSSELCKKHTDSVSPKELTEIFQLLLLLLLCCGNAETNPFSAKYQVTQLPWLGHPCWFKYMCVPSGFLEKGAPVFWSLFTENSTPCLRINTTDL